jgi:hypothetical protein
LRSRARARSTIARVATRNLAAEQGLQATKAVVTLLADGELDAVPLRGRVLDDGTACGWRSRDWLGRMFTVAMVSVPHRRYSCSLHPTGHSRREWEAFGRSSDIGPRRKLRDQCLDLTAAAAAGLGETASQFSVVRCWWSRRMDVSDIAPDTNDSRIAGKRRQVFATVMRLHAASSDRPSASVQ